MIFGWLSLSAGVTCTIIDHIRRNVFPEGRWEWSLVSDGSITQYSGPGEMMYRYCLLFQLLFNSRQVVNIVFKKLYRFPKTVGLNLIKFHNFLTGYRLHYFCVVPSYNKWRMESPKNKITIFPHMQIDTMQVMDITIHEPHPFDSYTNMHNKGCCSSPY